MGGGKGLYIVFEYLWKYHLLCYLYGEGIHTLIQTGKIHTFLTLLSIFCHSIIMVKQVDIIKCKHFPRYWPFVRGLHRSPVNSHHKGQWCGALMFSLICTWMNGWVNNSEACNLRCNRAHYNVIVICNELQNISVGTIICIMASDRLAVVGFLIYMPLMRD